MFQITVFDKKVCMMIETVIGKKLFLEMEGIILYVNIMILHKMRNRRWSYITSDSLFKHPNEPYFLNVLCVNTSSSLLN